MREPIRYGMLATLLLLAGSFMVRAQEATLYGTQKWVTSAKVKSMSKDKVHLDKTGSFSEKTLNIPFTELDSLRFADGFTIRFRDGTLIRDNVMQAPSFKASFMDVRAEGVLSLTQDEIRQYYGPWNYELVYLPYRKQFMTGIGKIGVGALGHIISNHFCSWYTMTVPDFCYYQEPGMPMTQTTRVYGKVTPVPATLSTFFVGMAVGGLVDCGVSVIGQRQLNRYGDQRAAPSPTSAKTLFWSGVALSLSGLAAMGVSFAQMQTHQSWSASYRTVVSGEPMEFTPVIEGEPLPDWVKYSLFGGAVVANLGFSAIQLGQTRLSAIRRLDGSPYAMQVNIGTSSSGYGLTVRF